MNVKSNKKKGLSVVPITLALANDFIDQLHRHHKNLNTHKFSLGCVNSGVLVGVCVVQRPCARKRDDGQSAEVARLCTDGTRNACSILYAAAARTAREMGFWRIGTYILESELGTTLKASGWKYTHMTETDGSGWARPASKRDNGRVVYAPLERKKHYQLQFRENLVEYRLPDFLVDLNTEDSYTLFPIQADHTVTEEYEAVKKPKRQALMTADDFR